MFYLLTIFFLALSTAPHTYAMDDDTFPIQAVPIEVTNKYVVPQLWLHEQHALVCTCKQFDNNLVRIYLTAIAPKNYGYITRLLQTNLINISCIYLLQLPNYDLNALFKAAKNYGVQKVIIECCPPISRFSSSSFSSSSCCPSKDGCQPLTVSALLNDNKKIEILAFAGRQLKIDSSDLCSALRTNSSLTELQLYDTQLPGKNTRDILRAVNVATNIKTLDLYANRMPEAQLNALRTNTSLTDLGLQFCCIREDAAAKSIVTFITNNTNLKTLKTMGSFGDVYDAIAPALKRLKLRNLNPQ